jgi:DNA polymerase epsilon subunit 2
MSGLNKRVFRAFKFNGLSISGAAVKALVSVISREDDQDKALATIVDAIKDRIQRQELTSTVIDIDAITEVIDELSKDDDDLNTESVQLFDAFKVPALKFNTARKTLYLDAEAKQLHAQASAKNQMFRDRFLLVQQRVLRNQLFSAPIISSSKREFVQLTQVEALLGSEGVKRLLGMLTQKEEGQYYLEDISGSIKLNLANAKTTNGLFTESCIVLVEGEASDGVFHVNVMGFPPPEKREDTLKVLPQLDILGSNHTDLHMQQLAELETASDDTMVVILSDLHLDKPQVFEKLELLFEGFAPLSPPIFVLMGNFTSQPIGLGSDGVQELVRHFSKLCTLILQYPNLAENSHFIFVPGPTDPGCGNVLPRPGLPVFFTKKLRDKLPHASFTSNPCRLRFFSQEMCLFREDILRKMQRNCIVPVSDEQQMELSEHMVKTLLDQAHLCPLPLAARPVYWQFDHALRLCPLPDVLICADKTEQYLWRYEHCAVVNPGSFPTDFSFVVYRPASKEIEFSKID